jgi:flagellar L-ring protein precursor FlgH
MGALLAVLCGLAAADDGGFFVSLYGDRRARNVGDTLHLLIVENTSANMKTNQTTQQKTASNVGPGVGKLSFLPMLGFSGSTSSSASGTSSRGGTVTARMTVQIVQVTDEGNLVVEGRRTVNVNQDKEVITIRGEVRPKDVRPDNTVYSYDLANVQIDFVGSNPRKPEHKVGIITRLINLFF